MSNSKYYLCDIYRADKVEELYLFVRKPDGMDLVPNSLSASFSSRSLVTTIRLDESRKLAKADAKVVMDNLSEHGFYLQLPPSDKEIFGDIALRNEKLPR